MLDVLKPYEPELLEFAEHVAEIESVDAANVSLIEIDREVQNVKLSVEGEDLSFEALEGTIRDLGATVHSVDEVACGEYLIDEPATSSLVRPAWLR